MFTVGAFGFLHEVFLVQPPAERPFLIAGSLALMGLPFVLQGDTILRGGGKTPEQRAEEERVEREKRKADLVAQLRELEGGDDPVH
jgi:hypothetical protein